MSTPDNPTHEHEPDGRREINLTPVDGKRQFVEINHPKPGARIDLILNSEDTLAIEVAGEDSYLIVGPRPEDDITLTPGDHVDIGRETTSQLALGDQTSRQHCALINHDGRLRIVDLESKNGTRVGLPVSVEFELHGEPSVVLPVDSEKQEQLKAKLQEYESREQSRDPYTRAFEYYKREILRALLNEGEIRSWQLHKRLQENAAQVSGLAPEVTNAEFDEAFGVIKDYVETGGRNNSGGSGLK